MWVTFSCTRSWRLRKHEAVWITPDELLAEGILISSNMMVSHLPDVGCAIVHQLVADIEGRTRSQM
jgi:hypothetical protein